MTDTRPLDATAYRRILGHYPTGVCAVTATGDNGPVGMVVGSFTSVSLDPMLVGFLPDRSSTTWPLIEAAGRFCVNILASDQEHLSTRFAARGGDKFAGLSHRLSANGSPILDDVVAWIDCDLHAVHEAGDHLIVLGAVRNMDAERAESPLIFHRRRFAQISYLTPVSV